MASRRVPLGPKNVEYPIIKSQKKPKSLVPPMDRADLVVLLRKINDQHCSPGLQICVIESDITNPTPERVELIFHMLLNVLYTVTPTMMNQMPLSVTIDHPELYDGFHYTINFLRILHHVMNACVIPEHDFGPLDLTEPKPKRIQHFFTAIVNYIKFTQYINKECRVYEYEEKMAISNDSLEEVKKKNDETKELIKQLRQQKIEEKEVEKNLCEEIAVAKDNLKDLLALQISSEEKLSICETAKNKAKKSWDAINEEYTCIQSRLEELNLQIVSSPDELNEKLLSIETELDEMRCIHEECLSNYNMWEVLSTKATSILPGISSIKDDVHSLIGKANVINEKTIQYDKVKDDITKCKQNGKEYFAKQQNIQRHLKLIQEEISGLTTEMKSKPNEKRNDELQSEVMRLKTLLDKKLLKDSETKRTIEEKQNQLQMLHQNHAKFQAQYETAIAQMKDSYKSYDQKLKRIEERI